MKRLWIPAALSLLPGCAGLYTHTDTSGMGTWQIRCGGDFISLPTVQ